MKVLERAQRDIATGELWLARERLVGALRQSPAHPDVLHLLGEVCWAMHDLPKAGLYWFLTDRPDSDERAATAFAAMRRRFGQGAALLTQIPLGDDLTAYPTAAQARLEPVITAASVDCVKEPTTTPDELPRWQEALLTAGFALVVVGNVALWLTGLIAVLYVVWT